jgi:uncharacterized membrane protein
MAGIGFELRRLFRKDTLYSKFKGMVFATFVSTGPMIVSVAMILVIGQILRSYGISLSDGNWLFQLFCTITFLR